MEQDKSAPFDGNIVISMEARNAVLRRLQYPSYKADSFRIDLYLSDAGYTKIGKQRFDGYEGSQNFWVKENPEKYPAMSADEIRQEIAESKADKLSAFLDDQKKWFLFQCSSCSSDFAFLYKMGLHTSVFFGYCYFLAL